MLPGLLQPDWLTRKPSLRAWTGVPFGVALLLALATLLIAGFAGPGYFLALRVTGRWSFLLFWMAFSGGPMATLFGSAFRPLAQRGREFGLAYAAAQSVHVAIIAWLYVISPKPPVPQSVLVFFGIGIVFTYLLAALSFRSVTRHIDPLLVRMLRIIGVYYIFYAFVRDLARNPLHGGALVFVAYFPFLTLAGTAALLRLAAWGKKAVLFFDKRHEGTFAN